MKKLFTFLVLVLLITGLKAQIVFQENFNAVTNDSMPTGWTVFNLDGLTPNVAITGPTSSGGLAQPFDKAWGCYDFSSQGLLTSKCAWSTSYFSTAAIANRWMFTPAIVVPTNFPVIQYIAYTPNASYPDGYELRLMTTAPTSGNITTSTVLYSVAAAPTTATIKTVDLSAYAGQTVYIGWRNNSNDKVILGIDNVVVTSLPATGATMTSISLASYLQTNTTQTIAGVLKNIGGQAITSLDLNYSINGGAKVTQNLTSLNIASLTNYNYSHSTTWAVPSTQGTYTIKVWADNINGNAAISSDTISKVVNTLTTLVFRKVVLEEYTGIHCTYCPDGHKRANDYKALHPNDVFIINIHQGQYATPGAGEPDFTTSFGNALAAQTGLTGYPAGTVNRHLFGTNTTTATDRGTWATNGNLILAMPTYVTLGINANINSTTRLLTVNVTSNYLANGPALNMMNVALIQNNVQGPQTGGSTYNPTQVLPNGKYNHGHMLRHLITGQWGDSITVTTNGTTFQKTYTYTLPASINGVNLDLTSVDVVAFITEGKQEIITGAEAVLTTYSVDELNNTSSLTVSPNPFSTSTNLNINLTEANNVSLKVMNVLGENVYEANQGKLTAGKHTIELNGQNFANGIYFVNLTIGNNTITKKVSVSR